jgi:hypothetical protein
MIAIGTTSYLAGSIFSMTVLADLIAISCSPDRPPKITPTRFFIVLKYGLAEGRENKLTSELDRDV